MDNSKIDQWLDLSGLLPPLPKEAAVKLRQTLGVDSSSQHTFLPNLICKKDFFNVILPCLKKELDPKLVEFIKQRVEKTFEIRKKLKKIKNKIIKIVGQGNFSALWLEREAFSADSMEHRALMTEAVIFIYSPEALQKIVTLFYAHNIPMIPYGEGGGYNMGVTPMAPAVTISLRGIDHISEIRTSRRNKDKFEISVGSGLPFKDLIAYLGKRNFVLRCDPNTPRAATGGIAATGSNGGRKAFEVILHGRSVTLNGTVVTFESDEQETRCISTEPFLMARKFFSIENISDFKKRLVNFQKVSAKPYVTLSKGSAKISLQGKKGLANMLAQKQENNEKKSFFPDDSSQNIQSLPISAFVGSEGCTGFIYETTFEIEKPLEWLQGACWHFQDASAALCAALAVKKLLHNEQPEYFEFISGASIRRYLIQDFPGVFSEKDEAVFILAVEGKTEESCAKRYLLNENTAKNALKKSGFDFESESFKIRKTSVIFQKNGQEEFELLRKPREELPKKLRTKCKTDMEIRTEYLVEVLKIIENTKPQNGNNQKQDVLFGHLTPHQTAIIHWNIGGFDLYDEEQAGIAWDYLQNVIDQAQNLASLDDPAGSSARFTGEHGVAGKAAFLWLNYIPQPDFERMCAVKDLLDPKNLFNPETLFLRTSYSRALRARLLNTSHDFIKSSILKSKKSFLQSSNNSLEQMISSENHVILEGQRCTRCNSCKICPVIDAEHELESLGKRNSSLSVLPSKRNILMFLERLAHARKVVQQEKTPFLKSKVFKVTRKMIQDGSKLLSKCFYCRRCDKSCPVDIQIQPLMQAYRMMGQISFRGSRFWRFIYERFLGEDFFKEFNFRILFFATLISSPVLFFVRRIKFIPDWLKTYTVPPQISFKSYCPKSFGIKRKKTENFVLITDEKNIKELSLHEKFGNDLVCIRYRGCVDTFGNPEATISVDTFFKKHLNARIVDLEKKMCCGFPFEADGLRERAKKSQILSLIEITKCIFDITQQYQLENKRIPQFVLFSNCPTCCESLRDTKNLLKEQKNLEYIKTQLKLPKSFALSALNYFVKDTAEIALDLINAMKKNEDEHFKKIEKSIGLKVPCHNTEQATEAQKNLLKSYYHSVFFYERCCGLSGTARLKHPKIGTQIAEKLFSQIREEPPDVVVSGCPSCRDGVKMQRDILKAKKDPQAAFHVSGIFEQILQDQKNKIP
jgi:FAD/FMN-containing dehydrogenase/Fe-S oxidoreductase